MYNPDTELMFPIRLIPVIGSDRTDAWNVLAQKASGDSATIEDQLAFVLMMVKMGGCLACNADSFRAMKGCTQCAKQTVRRHRGSDLELMELFQQSRKEVDNYLRKQGVSD